MYISFKALFIAERYLPLASSTTWCVFHRSGLTRSCVCSRRPRITNLPLPSASLWLPISSSRTSLTLLLGFRTFAFRTMGTTAALSSSGSYATNALRDRRTFSQAPGALVLDSHLMRELASSGTLSSGRITPVVRGSLRDPPSAWGPRSLRHLQTHAGQQERALHAVGAGAAATSSRSVVKVHGLRADDIRHPLDRQNTALMRAIPGLNEVGKMLLGPIQEQILVLENLGSGVHVTENQLPALHSLMVQAAELLQMPAPDLYVRQNPTPNAYTLAITGRKPFVVVHTALLDLLTPAETQAVLAHELGHLKCDHGIWLTFANLIALGAYSIPGGLGSMIASTVEEQLMRWLRAAELTCDRAAVVVTQDPRVVVSALMKLAGGSSALAHELSVDAFLEQARSYDEAASSSPLAWYLRNAQTRQLSHPLPVLRAREVDRWARSSEYKALLERGTVLLPQSNGHAASQGHKTQGKSSKSADESLTKGNSSGRLGAPLSSPAAAFSDSNRGYSWYVDKDSRW